MPQTIVQNEHSAPSHRQFEIEGVSVDALSVTEAASSICEELTRVRRPFGVHTINLDHVVKLRTDEAFRATYGQARFVLPDGFPIVLAGRMRGVTVDRAAGSDLIEPLCREAAARGIPVMFYGSSFEVLTAAAKQLVLRIPGLQIAGVFAPGQIDPRKPETLEGTDYLRACGGSICFVALGAPKQELAAARLAADIEAPVAMVCIGAGLDFIGGKEKRAPHFVQSYGLEWLWRWGSSPRRLTARYLDCIRVLPSVLIASARRAEQQ